MTPYSIIPKYSQFLSEKLARDKKCRDEKGSNYKYVPPNDIDPMQFRYPDEYKSRVPFSLDDCSIQRDPDVTQTNRYKTFYKNIADKQTCARQKGFWSQESYNRLNKEKMGTCWTTGEAQMCGQKADEVYTSTSVGSVKTMHNRVDKDKLRAACESYPICDFHETNVDRPDCFPRSATKEAFESIGPPADMPDPQDPALQTYLKNWYESAKGPKVLSSTGGIGCDGKIIQMNAANMQVRGITNYYDLEFLEGLDPTNSKNDAVFLKYLDKKTFEEYRKRYAEINKDRDLDRIAFNTLMIQYFNKITESFRAVPRIVDYQQNSIDKFTLKAVVEKPIL